MSSANDLPRCPHRVANVGRHWLVLLLTSLVAVTTVTESAHSKPLDYRLVDPASHMQPWPDDEEEVVFSKNTRLRIAAKWRTNLTGSREKKPVPTPTPVSQPLPKVPLPKVEVKILEDKSVEARKTPPVMSTLESLDTKIEEPIEENLKNENTEPTEIQLIEPADSSPATLAEISPQPKEIAQPEQPTKSEIERKVEQLVTPEPTENKQTARHTCYQAPPMSSLTASIALPTDNLPADVAAKCAKENPPQSDLRLVGGWAGTEYHWAATCMHHRPLYFEEVNAERYGYTPSYFFQPVFSAAHFFGTIPALPYKMAVDCPRDRIYTLGHYRPGSCVPRRHHHLPWSFKGAAAETGAIAGLILLIP